MAAASAPPTVRPYRPAGGPAETAAPGLAHGDRVMLSPVTGAGADRAARRQGPRHRRLGWMLALSLIVLFLAALAVSAAAQPTTPKPDPCSGPEPRPIPCAPAPTPPTTPLPESCKRNPLPYCFPSTTPGQPTATSSPTTTSTCSNIPPGQPRPPDCIPQPTTPPPSTGQRPPGTGNNGDPDCGITNIGGCIAKAINSVFRDLVNAALSPILDLLGHTALSTPTIDSLPGIGELWNNSWELVVAAYGLFVLVGGIVVMSHESIQARYSIKEIGPRIPVAFLASALSLFFADKFIQLANALTLGVLGGGVNPPSLGNTLKDAVQGIQSGGLFIILVGLVLVVVGLGLLIVYVVRIVITLILIISGPLFLMCHALPHTEPLARWWWKAITAVLAIQVAQALVLITAVRTFLSGGVHLFGSTLSALGTLVAAIALFFILFKIPFWLLSAVKVSSGRSFLGGLARAYIAAKTFGMVAGKAGAFGKAGAASAARGGGKSTGRGGGGSAGAADPPWPAQPRLAPTPEMVNKRLKAAHDAERTRAARQSRVPSQAPQFLQPTPQQTTHDPAVTPANQGPTMPPEFSSAPTPAAPTSRRGPQPGSAPQFQAAGGPRRRGAAPPPARPIRVASVPPHLRFQAATPQPPQPPSPPKPASAPAAPVFRQAQPEPRIGDAYRRTQSVPPPVFRAPKPAPGGEGK
ncbi:hypothetical protein LWC34_54030 [Kibdelosporangium philippinense]|uniref:TrbL/VirB6 plasmid conjugal transfer protein n=1 Tax=Kibdelosporangium philippinense TaxID=211113 RepID=A0ABS8ZVQ0_9PSEU|nr:hypothetical protein [Kibdelosporangium philippinense]MCE7011677.1 hypothetical protein [Kibdelosporangium philippinense]